MNTHAEIVALRMQLEEARNELLELRERNRKLNELVQANIAEAYEGVETGLTPDEVDELYTEGRTYRPKPTNFHD